MLVFFKKLYYLNVQKNEGAFGQLLLWLAVSPWDFSTFWVFTGETKNKNQKYPSLERFTSKRDTN